MTRLASTRSFRRIKYFEWLEYGELQRGRRHNIRGDIQVIVMLIVDR